MNILEQIKSPADLKYLSTMQLQTLATQIRELIIKTVAQNGGHLAPCLGTVELTLALHKVFACPRDKIVWDVGHQAYTHKILTGRREKFSTLRKKNGITGFPNRFESVYDAFGVGHASTSISAALGMAVARDLNRENYNVIAVIGDGALTGGEALEGLNNAGISKRRLIVILNDNEMSIAPNVGALSEYLSLIRIDEKYRRAKKDVHKFLSSIPHIGNSVLRTANYVKDGLKNAIVPGGFFESLGFTYIGPIDGHNLDDLINILEKIKLNIDGPILLHVQTKKGKGYIPAERHPDKFHGVGKFDISTGKPIASTSIIPTYTAVFSQAIVDLAVQDRNITAVTAAMPSGTGLQKFAELFPERFFDVGIAEEHAVTFAAGQASVGKKPVVAIYSTFAQRAYDQIIHDVALQNLPVVLCLDRAGLVGEDGPTHHGVFDIAYLRQIPNMVCMAPKDENELRQMVYSAIAYNCPCAIRYPRGRACGVEIQEEFTLIEKGKSELLSIGDDVALIAIGSMVQEAIKAKDELLQEKINCSVINARFAKPLDCNLILATARKVKFIVTIEEGILAGGFGSAILELLSDNHINIPTIRMGIKDKFIEQGTRQEILDECNLNSKSIVNVVKKFIHGSDK